MNLFWEVQPMEPVFSHRAYQLQFFLVFPPLFFIIKVVLQIEVQQQNLKQKLKFEIKNILIFAYFNQNLFMNIIKRFLNNKKVYQFSKRKNVISIGDQKVSLDFKQQQQNTRRQSTQVKAPQYQNNVKIQNIEWKFMKFDQLCSLKPYIRQHIIYDIKKHSFTATDEQILQISKIVSQNQQKIVEMTPYYKKILNIFNNQVGIVDQKLKEDRYLARMDFDQPQTQKVLHDTVHKFVNNIHEPKKLDNIAQPTFIKYLLGLKRDLLVKGQSINMSQTPKNVEIIKPINYQYQFWIDLHHNRKKNGDIEEYIIQQREINNPHESILLKKEFPKIKIKYYIKKKRSVDHQMGFCTKCQFLILVDSVEHIIKLQWKGPTSKKKQTTSEQLNEYTNRKYMVIDYDKIYQGNPTIKPVFLF